MVWDRSAAKVPDGSTEENIQSLSAPAMLDTHTSQQALASVLPLGSEPMYIYIYIYIHIHIHIRLRVCDATPDKILGDK
jgi:hypothetical protein